MRCCKWLRLVFISAAMAAPAFASEGGGGAYPHGAEGFLTGALPPPGNYAVNYVLYYSADSLKGRNGDSLPVDFDLEVAANVFRYIRVTDKKLFGASWAQHLFVPIMKVDVSTPAGSDDAFGLGDLIVDPIVLGWHAPPWHWACGIDIYVPVGEYDEKNIANIGRNYWTIEPVFAVSYLDHSCELSAKFMYDINDENDDNDYVTGDEFHFDYVAAVRWENAAIGLGGFYYEQITDDSGVGAPEDGNRGKQFAWGPQVAYQYGKASLILKYQQEAGTENRPEGDRFWLKIVCPL
jgi:hypothetical protein